MTQGRLQGRRVAIGVCGGIAAYKAIECIRLLTEAGAEVRVMMTPEATRFVTPLTLEALSYNPVAADWLTPQGGGESHISLAAWADLIAIVPATANTLAKLALGLADEIVSGTVLASRAPLVIAPPRLPTRPISSRRCSRVREKLAARRPTSSSAKTRGSTSNCPAAMAEARSISRCIGPVMSRARK